MANKKARCCFCRDYFDRDSCYTHNMVKFCTEEHYQLWAQKNVKVMMGGEDRSGREKQDDEPTALTRSLVNKRDGGACLRCGSTWRLNHHHIFYRSETKGKWWRHETCNLILLCQECHGMVHSDKSRYQSLCLQMIWLVSFNPKARWPSE